MNAHAFRTTRRLVALALLGGIALTLLIGCGFGRLAGGMMQNYEYQKLVQVLPKYDGLEGKSVAVLVDADMMTRYDFPVLVPQVTSGVTARISKFVPGASVVPAQVMVVWQHKTPQWTALPYGDIIEELNVDRVVYIDIQEFRIHPPGNAWMWEGVASANIGIIERDGLVSDYFTDEFQIVATYPDVENLTPDEVERRVIEDGLLYDFVQRIVWLFHEHEEPKHPDKYRPELEAKTK